MFLLELIESNSTALSPNLFYFLMQLDYFNSLKYIFKQEVLVF